MLFAFWDFQNFNVKNISKFKGMVETFFEDVPKDMLVIETIEFQKMAMANIYGLIYTEAKKF